MSGPRFCPGGAGVSAHVCGRLPGDLLYIEGEKRDKELYKRKVLLGNLNVATSAYATDV
jgi:hypothetical protein